MKSVIHLKLAIKQIILCIVTLISIWLFSCSNSPVTHEPIEPAQQQYVAATLENPSLQKVIPFTCNEGIQPGSALYKICMPDNWNNILVIFAHGYVIPFKPVELPNDEINGLSIPELFNSIGFAYATTSYRENGLVAQSAVEDLVELVQEVFIPNYGHPAHVLLIGFSQGGLIATLALEKHPDVFTGGIVGAGPVGDFHKQLNYIGEFRIVFDYFFPGIIPGSPVDIPPEVISAWESTYKPAVIDAITNASNKHKVEQLLSVTKAAYEKNNPETIVQTVLGLLDFNIYGTNDSKARLGGQPIDNKRKIYHGSDNDLWLNLCIQRFKADPGVAEEIRSNYNTSGNLSSQLVMIHTTKDEIVPYWHELLYGFKIFRNRAKKNHCAIPVFRYGHCNFKTYELLAAFGVLVLKVTSKDLTITNDTFLTADAQSRFLKLSKKYGAFPKIVNVNQVK